MPSCQSTSAEGWVLACSLSFICVLSPPLSTSTLSPEGSSIWARRADVDTWPGSGHELWQSNHRKRSTNKGSFVSFLVCMSFISFFIALDRTVNFA